MCVGTASGIIYNKSLDAEQRDIAAYCYGSQTSIMEGKSNQVGPTPDPETLTGRLLIAANDLQNNVFGNSVIFLMEALSEPLQSSCPGYLGLMLTRPIPTSEEGFSLFWGGPLSQNLVGYVLHNHPEIIAPGIDNIELVPGVYRLGATRLTDVSRILALPPEHRRIKIFNGYAGWGPGQLDLELIMEQWTTAPATVHYLFDVNPGDLWACLAAQRSAA